MEAGHYVVDIKKLFASVQGFSILTETEILRDLADARRIAGYESDSGSSVLSQDILPSSYPVKPRKWTLRPTISRSTRSAGAAECTEADIKANADAVNYVLTCLKQQPSLASEEAQLELIAQETDALKRSIGNCKAQCDEYEKDSAAKIRLIQHSLCGAISQCMLERQRAITLTAALDHVLNCKAAVQVLKQEIGSLQSTPIAAKKSRKQSLPVKKGKPSSSANEIDAQPVVYTLSADFRVWNKDNCSVTVSIYCGLEVVTPMGLAIVNKIRVHDHMVYLKLNFGMMYTPAAGVLKWCLSDITLAPNSCSNDEDVRYDGIAGYLSHIPGLFKSNLLIRPTSYEAMLARLKVVSDPSVPETSRGSGVEEDRVDLSLVPPSFRESMKRLRNELDTEISSAVTPGHTFDPFTVTFDRIDSSLHLSDGFLAETSSISAIPKKKVYTNRGDTVARALLIKEIGRVPSKDFAFASAFNPASLQRAVDELSGFSSDIKMWIGNFEQKTCQHSEQKSKLLMRHLANKDPKLRSTSDGRKRALANESGFGQKSRRIDRLD